MKLQVPEQVADDLVVAGVASDRSDTITKGFDPAGISLVVYNTVLNVVTLAEVPGRIIALRNALARWVSGPAAPDRPYTLVASGRGGTFEYELNSPPDEDALLAFLQQINVDDSEDA